MKLARYAKFFVSLVFTALGAAAVPFGWPVWAPIVISVAGTILVGAIPNAKKK